MRQIIPKGAFMTHHCEFVGRIVVVDDDQEMRDMLFEFLSHKGYQVQTFASGSEAFQALSENRLSIGPSEEVDLIISDMRMPDMDGVELVQRVKKVQPHIPVVLITAFGSIESAIEATKVGVYSYVTKPFKLAEFSHTVERAIHLSHLKKENKTLKAALIDPQLKNKIIGKSKCMTELVRLVERVAKASAHVLITGESGTGKEVIARTLHELSPRKAQPFVAINCSAIPEGLLESELFGHLKGAFTGAVSDKQGLFEEAHGGTLFLDEIGDLNFSLQAKLLRVLQDKKIKPVGSNKFKEMDVRIICATHKDLKNAIEEKTFREDLFYRLSVIPIHVPALRERREDIPLLAQFFLKKFTKENKTNEKAFTFEALQKLSQFSWPGNVRELENLIERVVVMTEDSKISVQDLPLPSTKDFDQFYLESVDDWPTLEQLERRYIRDILEKTNGKKEKASQILGINRRTLYRKELEMKSDRTTH